MAGSPYVSITVSTVLAMNFLDLLQVVSDERTAIEFLKAKGILHQQRLCNRHNLPEPMFLLVDAKTMHWQCRKEDCRQNTKNVGIRQDI